VLIAAVLVAFLSGILWHFIPIHPLWIYLISITLIAFLFHGYDKFQARKNGKRIPEIVLHLLTLFGGTIGTFLGRILFHHKTQKLKYRVIFILIVILQIGLLIGWVMETMNHP
jgi:uncharacterized membrane protein YsdA (DUF1294 family)